MSRTIMGLGDDLRRGFEAFQNGDFSTAADVARAVLTTAPNNAGALLLSGRIALIFGQVENALASFQLLTRLPNCPADVWVDMSSALLALRREDEAMAALQRAGELDPNAPHTFLAMGELALSMNQRDAAAVALRRVIALDPFETAAYQSLPLAAEIAPDSDEALRMEALSTDARLDPLQRADVLYGLSRLYKRAGARERFVSRMFAANAAQRQVGQSSKFQYANDFDRAERGLDAYAAGPQSGAQRSPTPIFIMGMPRSGTTLIEQIVAGHSDVAMGGELLYVGNVLGAAIEQRTGRPFADRVTDLDRAQIDELTLPASQYFATVAKGARFLTDKTPDNFFYLGVLQLLFPGCVLINIRRHPMDVCFSILQQPFDERAAHLHDIDLLAHYCARYEQLIDKAEARLGSALLSLRYEDLVRAPETEGRRLLEHCGLEWNAGLLDFHTRASAVHTFSSQQVRRGVNTDSVQAWRAFSGELSRVREALEAAGVPADRLA